MIVLMSARERRLVHTDNCKTPPAAGYLPRSVTVLLHIMDLVDIVMQLSTYPVAADSARGAEHCDRHPQLRQV